MYFSVSPISAFHKIDRVCICVCTCNCTVIHMCNYILTRSLFAALPNGVSATLRKAAAPRHTSQHLATRLQHACRGLDTLNGRSATRRPEKETNQMLCTEDIVLDNDFYGGSSPGASIHMCNYIFTSGFRWHSHIHSHLRARSHLHMPNADYTARERETDDTAEERDFSAQERVNTSGAEN